MPKNSNSNHKTVRIATIKISAIKKAATIKAILTKILKNRYKAPEFEFDSIIESEGVLDIMQDGYGFLALFGLQLSLLAR